MIFSRKLVIKLNDAHDIDYEYNDIAVNGGSRGPTERILSLDEWKRRLSSYNIKLVPLFESIKEDIINSIGKNINRKIQEEEKFKSLLSFFYIEAGNRNNLEKLFEIIKKNHKALEPVYDLGVKHH